MISNQIIKFHIKSNQIARVVNQIIIFKSNHVLYVIQSQFKSNHDLDLPTTENGARRLHTQPKK